MDSLTLVLSSQRSGSTLLCRDIASLGGLGAPREYFLGEFDGGTGPPATEADVLDRISLGVQDSAPDVGAVKLMVGQATTVATALGARRTGPAPALRSVLEWAQQRFDRVLLVVLVRNAVDQAISRVVAAETQVFHVDGAPAAPGDVDLQPARLNPLILDQLQRVLRSRQLLLDVAERSGGRALLLSYDDLTGRAEETTERLVGHARDQGFEPHATAVTRTLRKVIGSQDSAALRRAFLDHLATETGVEPTPVRHRSDQ